MPLEMLAALQQICWIYLEFVLLFLRHIWQDIATKPEITIKL